MSFYPVVLLLQEKGVVENQLRELLEENTALQAEQVRLREAGPLRRIISSDSISQLHLQTGMTRLYLQF